MVDFIWKIFSNRKEQLKLLFSIKGRWRNLVYAQRLGRCLARGEGSTPSLPTVKTKNIGVQLRYFFMYEVYEV